MAENIISMRDPLSYVNNFMHSIVIYDMSEYDVKHIILSLKCNSAGWDNFPAYLDKQCIDVYITPLTFILNQSMTEGVFPEILETASVITLYKSSRMKNINNYFTNVSCFSKILKNISEFLGEN